jgi:hypothetical protein
MFSRAGTLARYGNSIDAAANHHHMKVLALKAGS